MFTIFSFTKKHFRYQSNNDYPVRVDTMPTISFGTDYKISITPSIVNKQILKKPDYRLIKKTGPSPYEELLIKKNQNMKNFKNWFNAFSMVFLFTIIIDLLVNAQRHSTNGKKTVIIIITLSVLLCALIIRNLFILKKKKNKR